MPRLSAQHGGALVEATLLLTVLLPVIYGVVTIGHLVDLRQTVEQASRYVAWEATVYPEANLDGTVQDSLTARFFGNAENALHTSTSAPGSHQLWGESSPQPAANPGVRSRLQVDQDSTFAEYQRDVSGFSPGRSIGHLAAKSGELLAGLPGNTWGLTADGLTRATIGINLKADSLMGLGEVECSNNEQSMCLQTNSAILVDGWSASSDDHARRRVRSLVPATALEPLGDTVVIIGNLPMFKELKDLRNAFGHVDMQVLPEYAQP